MTESALEAGTSAPGAPYEPKHRRRDRAGDEAGGTPPAPPPAGASGGSSIARSLLGSASWTGLATLTPVAINLALTPFLIHGLGIEQYGIYALVATITIFLSTFDGGIGPSTQRFFSIYAGRGDRRSITRLLTTLCLVVAAGTAAFSVADWFASPLIVRLFRLPVQYRAESTFLLRTFGVLIGIGLLHLLFVSVLQAHHRFALTAKSVIFSYVAWSVGVYLTVRAHDGLRGIAIALVAEQVVATLVIVPSSFRYLSRRDIGLVSRREVGEFLRFAWRAQMVGLSTLVNLQFDGLVIGAFLPVRDVGLYTAGANVATQVRFVAESALSPVNSRLANVYSGEGLEAAKGEMRRMQKVWVGATTALTSTALGAAYFAITVWLGDRFTTSAFVCVILLAGHSASLLTEILCSYGGAIGRPDVESRFGISAVVCNVVLTVPLVLLGVLGVVSATSAGLILGSLYLLRLARRRLSADLPNFYADVPVLPALCTLAVTAAGEYLFSTFVPHGPVGLLACGVPALVGLAVFGCVWLRPRGVVKVVRSVRSGEPVTPILFAR